MNLPHTLPPQSPSSSSTTAAAAAAALLAPPVSVPPFPTSAHPLAVPPELSSLIQSRLSLIISRLSSQAETADVEQRLRVRLPHLFAAADSQSPPQQQQPSLSLSSLVDHTLLKADASTAEVERLCAEAVIHRFAAVCVNGQHVATAVRCLRQPAAAAASAAAGVRIAAVCAFPLGASLSSVKAQEARALQQAGADEVDVVCSLCMLREERMQAFHAELAAVVSACSPACVKVILETAALPAAAVVDGCLLSALAGAAFVKSSTGMHAAGGAQPQAVALMRAVVGWHSGIGVKASGGIRDWQTAAALVAAGASRLGTSSGVAIATGGQQRAAAAADSTTASY